MGAVEIDLGFTVGMQYNLFGSYHEYNADVVLKLRRWTLHPELLEAQAPAVPVEEKRQAESSNGSF
jgi:hypothetical protein